MKQVRIVSDGSGAGTKVFDAAGLEIDIPIYAIGWHIDGEKSVVTFEIHNPKIDIVGEASNG